MSWTINDSCCLGEVASSAGKYGDKYHVVSSSPFGPMVLSHCEPFSCNIRNIPGGLVSIFRACVAKWRF